MNFRIQIANILLSVLLGVCHSQFNTVPPCDNDGAARCVEEALEAAGPTGCNWYTVMPVLNDCVSNAVAGCYYAEQADWFNLANDVNITYMSNACYLPCQNEVTMQNQLQTCFQQYNPTITISNVLATPDANSQSSPCSSLSQMNSCATNAAGNCPALMDLAYYTIFTVQGANSAYQKCAIAPPAMATTNAPVALFNTMTTTGSTTNSNEILSTGVSILLIILGSIIIAATLVILICMCVLLARRRHAAYRKSLLGDWKPNGQTVYRDQPQVMTTTQPVIQNVFRPLRYTSNQGPFVNEAAQANYGPGFFNDVVLE